MFKKTMFVVGAIVAAAMPLADASAAPGHVIRSHHVGFAARAPRIARFPRPRTRIALRRPARGRLVRARFGRLVTPVMPMARQVSAWHQVSTWHRLARRERVASLYRPAVAYGSHAVRAGRRVAMRSRLASAFRPIPARLAPSIVAAAPAAAGVQTGRASFYHGGGRTAAGGHVGAATCAHRWLPFGTRVLVTNLANARRAVLTVNDRGPFVGGRIVDVSAGAAGLLGMLHSGTAPVSVQVVGGRG